MTLEGLDGSTTSKVKRKVSVLSPTIAVKVYSVSPTWLTRPDRAQVCSPR